MSKFDDFLKITLLPPPTTKKNSLSRKKTLHLAVVVGCRKQLVSTGNAITLICTDSKNAPFILQSTVDSFWSSHSQPSSKLVPRTSLAPVFDCLQYTTGRLCHMQCQCKEWADTQWQCLIAVTHKLYINEPCRAKQ